MPWVLEPAPPAPPPPPPPEPPFVDPAGGIADSLADYVSQWDLTGDLQTFARGIGQMFAEVETYAVDTDTTVGWQPLWDVDIAPTIGLPWLAMIMGEVAPQGATDAQLRALIRAAPNQDRGQPAAIANAVKQTLTGGQTVGLRERFDGSVTNNDAISVVTWLSETPNQTAVLAALRRTVPADIEAVYQCLTGPSWSALEGGNTWTQVYSTYGTTWSAIEGAAALSGYVVY